MTIDTFLAMIGNSALSLYLQESPWGFPAIESLHVLAITLVFGTITIVDLRLLGAASQQCAVTEMANDTLKWTWSAFALAAVTGSLLFSTNPTGYFYNGPFRYKMLCLLFAGINMIIFERITFKSVHQWDRECAVPSAGKLAGALSITFWIGVIAFGRWIGFTIK